MTVVVSEPSQIDDGIADLIQDLDDPDYSDRRDLVEIRRVLEEWVGKVETAIEEIDEKYDTVTVYGFNVVVGLLGMGPNEYLSDNEVDVIRRAIEVAITKTVVDRLGVYRVHALEVERQSKVDKTGRKIGEEQ